MQSNVDFKADFHALARAAHMGEGELLALLLRCIRFLPPAYKQLIAQ
jgi:hypothetical protein